MGYANTLGLNYRICMLMVRLWNCLVLRPSIPNESGYPRSVKFVPSLQFYHVYQIPMDLYFPSLSSGEEKCTAEDSESIRRRCLWSKHLRRTIIGSSVIVIDASGQIVLGCPPLVLECFKLGNYDSISHLSFSVLWVDVPVRKPL